MIENKNGQKSKNHGRSLLKKAAVLLAGILIIASISGCSSKTATTSNDEVKAIVNAKIFDGVNVIEDTTVVIKGEYILSVGGEVPEGATIIDAHGGTLMPGLIDSHVHTDMEGLRDALEFSVTTELEMQGSWSAKQRKEISERKDIADLRSPGMGVTPKNGHPTQYMASSSNIFIRLFYKFPSVSSPEEAIKHVDKQIAEGADYIKIFLEDGTTVGFPGLPVLDDATLNAAVQEAHKNNKLAIVHVTNLEQGKRAIAAGADALAHLFFDSRITDELVAEMASSNAFVIPTLVTISSALGHDASALAADERVKARLDQKWLDALSRSMNVYPQGKIEDAYASVMALHEAGVDILAGSDVSEPIPSLGGLAHGASLHMELQLLVKAGLEPIEALRAATSTPADRFSLTDRGRIIPGARADLLLVDGDPLTNISDTLNINTVWRGGVELTEED